MESTLTDKRAASPAADGSALSRLQPVEAGDPSGAPVTEEAVPSELLSDLDEPNLVLSPDYIGSDRRANGLRARVLRATFTPRRSLLRLELLVVAVVALLVLMWVLLAGSGTHPSVAPAANTSIDKSPAHRHAQVPAAAAPAPTTTSPPAPTTTVPVRSTAPPPSAGAASAAPSGAPAPAAAPATAPPASLTPDQMGAQALALVTYPWQRIPGYSIQFLPISDAPSPGFYGNTTFTMGQAGGQSVLYVYPGETVQRLAAITAFEIGHEVDAAGVYPANGNTGHAQIEQLLNYFPASWAPNCDCAEQSFLSGWYAAAFSNQWSPGVGSWSQILPEPSGATLAAIQPWLNPTIQ